MCTRGKPVGHMQAWPRRWTLDYLQQLQKAATIGPWIKIPVLLQLRACLHGGGVPQIGKVTRLGG